MRDHMIKHMSAPCWQLIQFVTELITKLKQLPYAYITVEYNIRTIKDAYKKCEQYENRINKEKDERTIIGREWRQPELCIER